MLLRINLSGPFAFAQPSLTNTTNQVTLQRLLDDPRGRRTCNDDRSDRSKLNKAREDLNMTQRSRIQPQTVQERTRKQSSTENFNRVFRKIIQVTRDRNPGRHSYILRLHIAVC